MTQHTPEVTLGASYIGDVEYMDGDFVYAQRWQRTVNSSGTQLTSTESKAGPYWETPGGYSLPGTISCFPAGQSTSHMYVYYLNNGGTPTIIRRYMQSGDTPGSNITLPGTLTTAASTFAHQLWYGRTNDVLYWITHGADSVEGNASRISRWTVGASSASHQALVGAASSYTALNIVGEDNSGNIYCHVRQTGLNVLRRYSADLSSSTDMALGTNTPQGSAWEYTAVCVANNGTELIFSPTSNANMYSYDITGMTLGTENWSQSMPLSTSGEYMRMLDDKFMFAFRDKSLWRVA